MSTLARLLVLVAFATIYVSQASAATKNATITVKVVDKDMEICYFGSWAVYRGGNGKFDVEDIDTNLCTHIIYSFVGINDDGTIKILDSWNDLDKRAIERFVNLKQKKSSLKVMVAVGGWNEGSPKYSNMASSPQLRANFIQSIINFMNKYGFDGVDIDWEYPAQREGRPTDKANFALLVSEMRNKFNGLAGKRFLLTAAVAATAKAADVSYEVASLSQNLDWINLMTYDFHGAYDGRTGQNSPLYASSIDIGPEEQQKNLAACVQTWISRGARPEKLVLGIGTYGHSFKLQSNSNHGLGAPTSGNGNAGPYTAEAGSLGYNEICEKQRDNSWAIVWDDQQKVPYTYKGDQWVGYDNERSVKLKVAYAKSKGLAGVMVWSIITDDFRGICGRKYPLLNAIKEQLGV